MFVIFFRMINENKQNDHFYQQQFKAGWSKEERMCQKQMKEVPEKMAVISLPIIMLPFKWIKPAV